MRQSRKRSYKRCSSGCGSTPTASTRTRGPLRAYLLAMTHSRAVERVRAEDSLRRRHENASREALREPPVEDPEVAARRQGRQRGGPNCACRAPGIPTRADRDGVLRGHVVPAGCRRTGGAGRHGEVPHPLRDAEVAHGVAGSRGRAMSYPNDEAEDRVIARALDAEEADEAAMDRATLDEYRRVLAHLPFEEVAPPAALEHRVFEAALASPAGRGSEHRGPGGQAPLDGPVGHARRRSGRRGRRGHLHVHDVGRLGRSRRTCGAHAHRRCPRQHRQPARRDAPRR